MVNVHACPEGVIYSGLIKVERETFYIEEVKDALLYSQEEWEALLPELEAEPSPLLFRSSFKAQFPPQPVERYYVLAEECGFFGEKKELHLLAASASVDLLKDQISREICSPYHSRFCCRLAPHLCRWRWSRLSLRITATGT
mgnify:CR=1 FL=1